LQNTLDMSFLRPFVAAAAVAIASAGCSSGPSVTMADSFDLDVFGPHEDDLHTPYVAGASFQITVKTSQGSVPSGWTLSSSDPNVMRVTGALVGGTATVTAEAPGSAVLSVINQSGNVVDSHDVSVAIPDQVGVYAEGLLLTGAPDSVAQVTQASIVSDGQATFLVRYFSQGTELYGGGVLAPQGTNGISAATVTASFASARDFLQVTPSDASASGAVVLNVDSVAVGELPVTTVDPGHVTHVTILTETSEAAQQGQTLALYAHAVDATSVDVYGASFNWKINGQTQASAWTGGPSDLFFYTYDDSVTETVAAAYETFAPSAVVHGQGGSVGSTSNVGCSSSPGGGSSSATLPLFGLLLGAGLLVRRARRRSV
jgi:MYXO-CTERM domain-containing protein